MNVSEREDVQSIVSKLPRYFKAMQVPCQSVRVSHALLECHAPLGVTSTMVRSTRLRTEAQIQMLLDSQVPNGKTDLTGRTMGNTVFFNKNQKTQEL